MVSLPGEMCEENFSRRVFQTLVTYKINFAIQVDCRFKCNCIFKFFCADAKKKKKYKNLFHQRFSETRRDLQSICKKTRSPTCV